MPEPVSLLYVPLRSNAKTLVTGAPIVALRRRLKYASVFHDQLLLESGILRMHAGEGGSSSFVVPATGPEPTRWQTPRQRQLAQQSPFQLSVGREITPGVPAEVMRPMLTSDSTISWTATLEPVAAELPAGADWIHFGKFTKPGPGVDRIAQEWTWADQNNPYLDQAIPGRFVRAAVIKAVLAAVLAAPPGADHLLSAARHALGYAEPPHRHDVRDALSIWATARQAGRFRQPASAYAHAGHRHDGTPRITEGHLLAERQTATRFRRDRRAPLIPSPGPPMPYACRPVTSFVMSISRHRSGSCANFVMGDGR